MKVFLSSTCYDLADVRAVLEDYLARHGHIPLLNDRHSFPVDPGMHRHDVCVHGVGDANLFILVVDGRYGAPYARNHEISITHAEFKAAAGNVPMIAFVRRSIWDERNTFRENPSLKPVTVDSAKTFELIDDVQAHPAGVWLVTQFDTVNNIIASLDSLQMPTPKPWCDGFTPEIFLERFYEPKEPRGLKPLRIRQPRREPVVTAFYTKPEWLRLRIPVDAVVCEVSDQDPPTQVDNEPIYAKLIESSMLFRKVELWSDPCYRLIDYDVTAVGARLRFSGAESTNYLRYRFSAGLMSDELNDAAREHVIDQILARRSLLLPRRCLWMPNADAIENVTRRFSAGGTATLFAMARGAPDHDYYVPLHVRSAAVAENRGFGAVSFNGYHQWFVNRENESHLRWTIFRELYEEVFGGAEASRPSKRVKHDWYFNESYMDFFRKHSETIVNELIGFGFNTVVGNWECATLLVVQDERYWEQFGDMMKYGWEAENVLGFSTKHIHSWQRAIQERRWAGDSLVALLDGLKRLHELEPDRFGFDVDTLATIEL